MNNTQAEPRTTLDSSREPEQPTEAQPSDNAERKHKGGPWPKGVSGNPKGMPKGTRHRATRAAETLLDGEAEELTRLCIEKAKGGDMVALRLCLERIIPARKDRPVTVDLPKVTAASDLIAAAAALTQAVASGDLTPSEGADISRMVTTTARAIEVVELETASASSKKPRARSSEPQRRPRTPVSATAEAPKTASSRSWRL